MSERSQRKAIADTLEEQTDVWNGRETTSSSAACSWRCDLTSSDELPGNAGRDSFGKGNETWQHPGDFLLAVRRWLWLTGPQQLIGEGSVAWPILQCLEAKPTACSEALPQSAAGIPLWVPRRMMVSRIEIVCFIIYRGGPSSALSAVTHEKHTACHFELALTARLPSAYNASTLHSISTVGQFGPVKNSMRPLPHGGAKGAISVETLVYLKSFVGFEERSTAH